MKGGKPANKELRKLEGKVKVLEKDSATLRAENGQLRREVKELRSENDEIKKELAEIRRSLQTKAEIEPEVAEEERIGGDETSTCSDSHTSIHDQPIDAGN